MLLVAPWDQRFGGVNTVLRNLAEYLSEHGVVPLFLFPGDSVTPAPGVSELGYPAVRMNLRPLMVPRRPFVSLAGFALRFPAALWHLVRLVRQARIRVVNVHYADDHAFYFAELRRLTGVRLVASLHGSDVTGSAGEPMLRWSIAHLLRHADVVVAPSDAFADVVRREFPLAAAKVVTILNGVKLDAFASMAEHVPAEASRVLASLTGGQPYVACVAAFNHKKAHDTLLRAFALLRAPHRLVLVGEGPLQREIERLIRELGVQGRVVLAGCQPPAVVAPLLAGAACSVLPSRNEPFGIAAVESLAVGTPIVTSGVGGLAEVVRDGETGLLFPVDDAPALARTLDRLLADDELRARLGRAGRSDVRSRFDWRAFAARYVTDVYHLAAATGAPPHAPR